jgi:hypothetical protein
MANDRRQRLMQDALDDRLSPDALQHLYEQLDSDPDDADAFSRLRDADRLLKHAPHERAPQSLALRIMAQIAELQPAALTRTTGAALALALALVALLLAPLVAAASWLLINALTNPSGMSVLLQVALNAIASLLQALQSLVLSAQSWIANSVALPMALVALLPAGVIALWRLAISSPRTAEGD